MSSETGEQKRTLPTKSSMEILSELFSTFHAEPPLIIKKEKSEEPSKKHKKSKKKHKHKDKKHKKKEKKKRKNSSSSSASEDSELDLAKILIKKEKDISEKKIKVENTELRIKQLKALKKERELEHKLNDRTKAELNDTVKRNKVLIKNLNLNSIFESTIKEIENKVKREVDDEGEICDSESSSSDEDKTKEKQKSRLTKRSRSGSTDTNKKLKTDNIKKKIKIGNRYSERNPERTHGKEKDRHRDYGNEKDFYKGSYGRNSVDYRSKNRDRERTKDRQRSHRSRSRERHKDVYNRDLDDYRRNRNKDYKDDGFYKSREKEDKEEKSTVRDRQVNICF